MMEFQSIASGSGGNAYLVTEDTAAPLLIEAGTKYAAIQQAMGHRVTSLAGCLISHQHGDHACAATEMMRAGVDIWTSQDCADALSLSGHRLRIMLPRAPVTIGPWRVMAWEAVHDVTCYGFLVQSPAGDKLMYATDTAYIPYTFKELTHICIGANYSEKILMGRAQRGELPRAHMRRVLRAHMSIERVLEFLESNDLRNLRELHLLHLSAGNSDEARFLEQARRTVGVPVYVAQE